MTINKWAYMFMGRGAARIFKHGTCNSLIT